VKDAAQHEPSAYADAARVPAVAGLAAALAILDVVGRRGFVRVVGGAVPHASRLAFEPYTRMLMNALALAATLATVDAMALLLRRREAASLARRISKAGLMMLFVPCTAIALFLPIEHTSMLLVLLASVLAHVFSAQLALGSFEHRADVAVRLTNVAVFGATVGAILWITLNAIGPQQGWVWSYDVARIARGVGELSWSLAPVAAIIALVRRDPKRVRSVRLAVASVTALGALALALEARAYAGAEYATLLYGASLHGALSRDGVDRQLGYACACLLGAGFAPHAPLELSLLVCAAALFARALVAAVRPVPS
jgi:hypothetical protein